MTLDTPVQYLKGVGPYIAGLLKRRNITTVRDLIYHVPMRWIDRREISAIVNVETGRNRTVIGEVVASGVAWIGRRRKRIFELIIRDKTGAISAKWFNFHPKYMERRFPQGAIVLLAGDVSEYGGAKQFIHPEAELLDNENDSSFEVGGKIIAIYPSTEGLMQGRIRKIIKTAWEKYSDYIKDTVPEDLCCQHNLIPIKEALFELHFPAVDADITLLNARRSAAHRTLIFEEFFMLEIALLMKKRMNASLPGIEFVWSETEEEKFKSVLGFSLTSAQKRAIDDIRRDMSSSRPMNRLLQGDVGSGKTVVAVSAAIQAIKNGWQAAIMAPTEILAEQHFRNVSKYAEALQIPTALLTSSVKGSLREKIYKGVETGAIKLVFGTHALIHEDLKFAKLGFAVVDEQHRFGVAQRLALNKKGVSPDILVMTATPIPRTLAMTFYGDLDVSVIDEMPAGRKPVITKIYFERDRKKLYDGMRKELEKGHQVYVVYPLIEESEKVDLKNATEMSNVLKGIFEPRFRVELLHGRMKQEEKESIMERFKNGQVSILAATSVVEVGVDIPNATVMVVEHAERFGLSQLHQMRGRVGRSNLQSYCILMTAWSKSEDAKKRLNIMQETTDGFRIAEEDLRIRGPGEFMGTRQSGIPQFHVANLIDDIGILELARESAFRIEIDNYPELKKRVFEWWGSRLDLSSA